MPNYLSNIGIFGPQGTAWPGWSGLTAYYRFNETSGTAVSDSFGSTTGTTTNTWTSSGKRSYAAQFASAQIATITETNSIRFTGNFGYSVWVYIDSLTPTTGSIVFHKGVYPTYNYSLNIDQNGIFAMALARNGSYDAATASSSALATTRWYHLVGTYNTSTGQKLYINGEEKGSNANTGTLSNLSCPLYIGKYQPSGTYAFKGRMDELAFFNVTLSATDAATLYNYGQGIFY
jgi:hypothetical protein